MRYLIRAGDLPAAAPDRPRDEDRRGRRADDRDRVEAKVVSAVSNLLGNTPLERAMQDNLDRLGPPPFDAADRESRRVPGDVDGGGYRVRLAPRRRARRDDTPLCDAVPRWHRGRADDRLHRRR